ncbi:MAG: N-acetyl-gamma-glutamyl-phosphate reductase [Bdellovibrionaceae bacterium]|nr:N-acetyl-gamma-glutamyl-phosphate reductase [Pseudobdellovibrionaceae bacterium]
MTHKYDASFSPSKTLARVAVVGARGYSGLELVRGLLPRRDIALTEVYASKAFDLAAEVELPGVEQIQVAGESEILKTQADLVFLATPAEVSLELAPQLVALGKKVIDLSGAFRLHTHAIKEWYGFDVKPELLAMARYSLVPFAGPFAKDVKIVSNPGCYATAIQMALVPLLKKGLIDPAMIVVDAKSGTSGAGRKANESQLFTEVAEDLRPYRVGRHQHLPEIEEGLSQYSGTQPELFFSTHLLPIRHGIQAAIYAKTSARLEQVEAAYAEAFADYPLAKFGSLEKKPQLANLTKVVGTAETRISYEIRDGKLYVFSCIDNRLKGAATQAIENMNVWLDLPATAGLYFHPAPAKATGSQNGGRS